MRQLMRLGPALLAALALMALAGAGGASATTLEVEGTPKNEAVAITATLAEGSSMELKTTSGGFANTCTASHVRGATASPFSDTGVGGPLNELSFGTCTNEKIVVHKPGNLRFAWVSGTTNGTVTSSGAEVTVPSPIGNLNCKTGAGIDIGTLTGVTKAQEEAEFPIRHATLHLNVVINCGFLVPSAKWAGSYTLTSPTGLGVAQ